jgi:hypothetical protein
VSCAATHVPESKTANQSFRYNGFRKAAKVELLFGSSFTGVVTGPSQSFVHRLANIVLDGDLILSASIALERSVSR